MARPRGFHRSALLLLCTAVPTGALLLPTPPDGRRLPRLSRGRRRQVASASVRACEAAAKANATRAAILREMVGVGAPALVGLAIEPVASLVDTAFMGRCCSAVQLAGVGVGISIFNVVAKAFNFLSPATTSLVAAASSSGDEAGAFSDSMVRVTSASLAVAAGLGLTVTAALTFSIGSILDVIVRVPPSDPLRASARGYLIFRALAAPGVLGMLCMQGAFRGARDT